MLIIWHIFRTASEAMPYLSTNTTDFYKPCACTIASDCGTVTTFSAHGFLPSHSMNGVHMWNRFVPFATITIGAFIFFATMETIHVNGSMSFGVGYTGMTTTLPSESSTFLERSESEYCLSRE